MGRERRPVHQQRPDDDHDAAAQAGRAGSDRDGARRRLPRLRLPPATIRVRLTALHALLSGLTVAVLLGVSYWLLARHLDRTLPERAARDALSEVGLQYALAFVGTLLVTLAVAWLVSGRALAPVKRILRTARAVSDERLEERIEVAGPRDELRELAETLNSMLDRLEDSFDGQRRFIANASHELRSPLTVIRSQAEIALSNPDADVHELRAALEAVVEGSQRSEALLESLLLLARSQRGMLAHEHVDLAVAARAAAATAEREADARGLDIRVEAGAAPTLGDRRLLERLAANLVENAVRYNRRGGVVEIATGTANGYATLRVENTGPPVDAEAARRLAEPFQRLTRGAEGRGAGLGLSIVHSVTEAHGGTLRIAPRRQGGLRAQVELPAAGDRRRPG
jgi:signal transduction histidine kinase